MTIRIAVVLTTVSIFIITCTENGFLHVVDVDTGATIQSIKHTPKSLNNHTQVTNFAQTTIKHAPKHATNNKNV